MTRIALVLFVVVVPLIFASCGDRSESNAGSGGSSSPLEPSTILQFQSSSEVLTLPSLQVGESVYTGVTLRLAKDGAWQLTSIGPKRSLSPGESIPAVLNAPNNTVIDMNWRPADATITIGRLHIDAKVIGNAALRLAGDKWYWGSGSRELLAVTLADFKANPTLVASEAHHVVLQSAPESGTQRFPLRLTTKIYKFCMDRQDGGADRISLFDPAGNEVFSLKAGDACVNIKLAEGLYTMQHVYGGSGTRRTIFIRPAAKPATAPVQSASKLIRAASALNDQDAGYPEYWAVHVEAVAPQPESVPSAGFLSFNGWDARKTGGACVGFIDGAAEISPTRRDGDPVYHSLFEGSNFFLITRDGNGVATSFGVPVSCPESTGVSNVYGWANSLPVLAVGGAPSAPNVFWTALNIELDLQNFKDNQFKLTVPAIDPPHSPVPVGFTDGIVSKSFETLFNSSDTPQNVLNILLPGQEKYAEVYQVAFRYFPNGLPPSMATAGGWSLGPGEVALFSGTDCSGPAMVTENFNLSDSQPVGDIGGFTGSLKLGLDTTATVYSGTFYAGESRILYESGCLNNAFRPLPTGGAPPSMQVSTDAATIVIQTNQCEYCNLAGANLSELDLSIPGGVKLQHTDLSGATINNTNLSGADLRFAILQGANLSRSNLEAANLCSAQLNGSAALANAAKLFGAHLKNANLALANLDGASFNSASFYSSTHQTACQPTDCATYAAPICASAYGASMNNTQFNSAYISNVDMGTVTGAGANFSTAIVVGVSFAKANFSHNAATSVSTKFNNTYLQGADFTLANLAYADFTGAYVDLGSTCMQASLIKDFANFPGYKLPVSPGSSTCVAGTQTASMCIQTSYPATPAFPVTDCTNTCADGSGGGGSAGGSCTTSCSAQSWTGLGNPSVPTSGCFTPPLLCGDAFASTINQCW